MTWLNTETTFFSNLFYIAFLNKLYLKFVLRYFRFFGRFVSSIKFAFFSCSFAGKRVNQKVAHPRSRKETTQGTNTSRCAYENQGHSSKIMALVEVHRLIYESTWMKTRALHSTYISTYTIHRGEMASAEYLYEVVLWILNRIHSSHEYT